MALLRAKQPPRARKLKCTVESKDHCIAFCYSYHAPKIGKDKLQILKSDFEKWTLELYCVTLKIDGQEKRLGRKDLYYVDSVLSILENLADKLTYQNYKKKEDFKSQKLLIYVDTYSN